MNQPHKHAELIKAWADGAVIQYRHNTSENWTDAECPTWEDWVEYRIKPRNVLRFIPVWVNPEGFDKVSIAAAYTREETAWSRLGFLHGDDFPDAVIVLEINPETLEARVVETKKEH